MPFPEAIIMEDEAFANILKQKMALTHLLRYTYPYTFVTCFLEAKWSYTLSSLTYRRCQWPASIHKGRFIESQRWYIREVNMVNQPKKNSKARLCFHIRRHSGANAKLLTADTSTLRAVSASMCTYQSRMDAITHKILVTPWVSPPLAVPIQIFPN